MSKAKVRQFRRSARLRVAARLDVRLLNAAQLLTVKGAAQRPGTLMAERF
jgi:hypothetical protein